MGEALGGFTLHRGGFSTKLTSLQSEGKAGGQCDYRHEEV